ncbi:MULTISPECIES: hypothetical protein [unclassified Mesorhizobium]|uniref:hypothetical protein n=1 Tax=unclassified Mesorhizobium TaxID=325217 RepID=UPI001FEF87B8|nr:MULTISPECIES: hypothetical protein [unclassified Mesorhizobium]
MCFARNPGYASAVTTAMACCAPNMPASCRPCYISVNGRYQSLARIRTMLSGVTTPLANAGKVLVTV